MSISNSLSKMLRGTLLLFAIVTSLTAMAQGTTDELVRINARTKVQFVTPDALDQAMIALRPYAASPKPGQDSLIIDTYRSTARGYAINNHFKQAYQVYVRYIAFKENMLTRKRDSTLAHALGNIGSKMSKDEMEQMDLLNRLQQLQIDNDVLVSKRSNFKRYFSFGLILLSAIFAAMLVSSGMKLTGFKAQLKQGRDRMKVLH